jgi:hypothetical protein
MAYATVAQLRAYLGLDLNSDDPLLESLLGRGQAAIEHYTHRLFEAASDTTKLFDAQLDTSDHYMVLDWTPYGLDLCQITTVTNGDGTTVAASAYVTNPRNETPWYGLRFKLNSGLYWTFDADPENAISIVGRWAYSVTAPSDIVQATVRMAAYLYRQKDTGTFDVTAIPGSGVIEVPQGMPRDVVKMLEPYRRLR